MAATATYTWSAFSSDEAIAGLRVGFKQTKDNDLSQTGVLVPDVRSYAMASFKTVIDGRTLWINDVGQVVKVVPEDSSLIEQFVMIVTCEMATTYGTSQGITRSVSEDSQDVATLSSMEPRDQFALYAMQAIMRGLKEPESLDDANILFNCRAAYRWAQGMMIASADARSERKKQEESGGSSEEGGEESTITRAAVDTSSGTDTEKLLGNLVASIDDLTKQAKENNENLLKATLKTQVDNATKEEGEETVEKKLQVEGAGGGSNLNHADVNDSASDVTDVLGYNTAIGKAPVRFTIANFLKKLISLDTPLAWLRKKDETEIASASTFFTQYKEEMATALADKFDAKGSAAQALTDAKAYTDQKTQS